MSPGGVPSRAGAGGGRPFKVQSSKWARASVGLEPGTAPPWRSGHGQGTDHATVTHQVQVPAVEAADFQPVGASRQGRDDEE